MSYSNIILIGGGGHCKSVIDVIEKQNKYNIIGILDISEKIGGTILNYEINASDDDIDQLALENIGFIITVGHIASPELRIRLFNKVKINKGKLPIIKSPSAHVSKHAYIGEGTVIMHGAVINADAKIGSNCIINNQAIVEHDCNIGNHCHISTGSIINGGCRIGNNAFIGSNVVTKQYIEIPQNTIIGMGSVITKTVEVSGTYIGNPIKRLK